jgi:hypothetical protein
MILRICVSAFFLVAFLQTPAFSQRVEKYAVFFAACTLSTDTVPCMALRSFTQGGTKKLLVVYPAMLATRIVAQDSTRCGKSPLDSLRRQFSGQPYILALDSADNNEKIIQDAGLTHGYPHQDGIDLTADLCPSKRPMAREFFTDLISQFLPREKPVPIALAVTGNWMYTHQDDLKWIIGLEDSGDLAITWINHSYNHRMVRDVPNNKNFLLDKGTDLDFEVLKTEQKMIEYGITPSVFFRFPGLVSDSLVFAKITAYGLIPVGTDAWLAKNQKPHNGSIVLVHANGNEPYGIKQFFKLIRDERDSINAGKWMLYDLRESVAESEKK